MTRSKFLEITGTTDGYKYFTDEESLIAVRANGNALHHVETQTEEICLAAVPHGGDALRYLTK